MIELWETFLLQLDAGEEGNPLYGNVAGDAAAPPVVEGTAEATPTEEA